MKVHSPPDNGASFMGKYSIVNPMVCWLIGKGHGELVALRPDEIHNGRERAPVCRAPVEVEHKPGKWRKTKPAQRCDRPMRVRPFGWACYEHSAPIKVPYPARIQKVPNFPGRFEDALTQIVDMEYAYVPERGRSEWVYRTRPL